MPAASFIRLGLENAGRILDKYHQTGIFQELEEGKLSEESFREKLGILCGKPLEREEVRQAWMGFVSGMDIRKLDYIAQLRQRGYRTFLLSNTNPYLMDYWARTPQFTPQGNSIDAYFDKLYLSFEMGCMKPEPEIFRQMIKDAQIRPEETLFIDDSTSNITAGKNAGLQTFQPENASDWRPENASDWREEVEELLARID